MYSKWLSLLEIMAWQCHILQNYTEEFSVNMEFPVTAGVVGVLLLPTLAALGAAVALMAQCTIAVERWD